MRAGELDQRMTIQQGTDVITTAGGTTTTYADLHANIACRRMFGGGGEKFEQDRETSTTIAKFKIRWIAGLNEKMRVVFDSNNYDIVDIDYLGRREAVMIKAEKKF